MQQLSGQDASFVYMETPATPMHIGSVGIYDPSTAPGGFVRFKDILKFVESRLGGARCFRQRLVRVPLDLDHPYWIEDPDFDIEFHIRHIALPKPGDWRQLCIQVARLQSRPMDLSKPLWEFNVIEGLDNIPGLPPGCFALMNKVHHAAIDGMSGVELSAAIHDLTPDLPDRDFPANWKPDSRPGIAELLAKTYMNNLKQPFKYAQVAAQTMPGLAKLAGGLSAGELKTAGGNVMAPKTRLNGKVGPHRVWNAVTYPLGGIKAIKAGVDGATVNDVVLAIVGGGLRKWLEAKGELPAESMRAMAPISVRASGEKAALGNLVSAMVVPLGTHIGDAAERLRFVQAETVASKALTNAIGARALTDVSQLMPAALTGLAARLYTRLGVANAHAPVFNCVVTNVPGARLPVYFVGAKMLHMYGTGPIFDGMGLINSIYSYDQDVAISFTSDRAMMPDPDFYAECLQTAYDELCAAFVTAAAAAPKPTARPKRAKAQPQMQGA